MSEIYQAGQFEIQFSQLISSSGQTVDIDYAIVTLTLFEDIAKPVLSGQMMVADSVNLSSMFPLIGQEYLKLKIATAGDSDASRVIDFTENALYVNKISARQDMGNGVQAYGISFSSREHRVNERVRVNRTLTGSSTDIVKQVFQNHLGTKKRLFLEPSADNRKFLSANKRPFELIKDMANLAISQKHNEPCYLCFETYRGFHFRSLASLYAQPSKQEFFDITAGTRNKKGAIDVEADFSAIIGFEIVRSQDPILSNRAGTYASTLYTHDIVSKKYEKHTYDYIANFEKEMHIEKTNSRFQGDGKEDFPIVSDVIITDDGKNISSFPARTFVQPTSGAGVSNNMVDEFNQNTFSSNSPEKWLQRRNSQMHQLITGYTVRIGVKGSTNIQAGDVVDINLPYTASTKTTENEKFDRIYNGKFLVSKIRHDFDNTNAEHTMRIEGVKDSLNKQLPTSTNPEPIQSGDQEITDTLY